MYYVIYYFDGEARIKQFLKLDEAESFRELKIKDSQSTGKITGIKLLTELTEQVNYKEKFEELYDYLLKNTGIRETKYEQL